MARLNLIVSVLLALVGLALDILAFTSRCSMSPPINISMMLLGVIIQVVAVGFPIYFGRPYADDPPRRGVAIIGFALVIFVAGAMAFRYSVLLPDAIGKPNGYRSASLACRHSG